MFSLFVYIGLHRDCARWGLKAPKMQKRHAPFWELFITDCWQALATGRLPYHSSIASYHGMWTRCWARMGHQNRRSRAGRPDSGPNASPGGPGHTDITHPETFHYLRAGPEDPRHGVSQVRYGLTAGGRRAFKENEPLHVENLLTSQCVFSFQ
ncbi:hypothetical protein K438DRAFT_2007185 [Mycena galopus ATCC 62051]|nr:hypothetical protein K438DRAFT_2007185 [Mycena galopus ATCC 62051]